MIVAINTIRIQSGHASEVAERFRNPKGVQHAPGFIKMELLQSSEEEHDELKVCTTWESKEAFEGWVNSDAFKQAHSHSRPASPSGGTNEGAAAHRPPSVMLGSKLSLHEVVFSTSPSGENTAE